MGISSAISTLASGLFAGERLPRHKRSIALSAARSWLFNAVVAKRVELGIWNRLLVGDLANLDGSASVFTVEKLDASLQGRLTAFDVHPSGPLPGRRGPLPGPEVAALETQAMAPWADMIAGLENQGVDAVRRATRLRPINLAWNWSHDTLELSFELGTRRLCHQRATRAVHLSRASGA